MSIEKIKPFSEAKEESVEVELVNHQVQDDSAKLDISDAKHEEEIYEIN